MEMYRLLLTEEELLWQNLQLLVIATAFIVVAVLQMFVFQEEHGIMQQV